MSSCHWQSRSGLPTGSHVPLIPKHHRAAAVLTLWIVPSKRSIVERMVLHLHGEPFVLRIQAGARVTGPTLQNSANSSGSHNGNVSRHAFWIR